MGYWINSRQFLFTGTHLVGWIKTSSLCHPCMPWCQRKLLLLQVPQDVLSWCYWRQNYITKVEIIVDFYSQWLFPSIPYKYRQHKEIIFLGPWSNNLHFYIRILELVRILVLLVLPEDGLTNHQGQNEDIGIGQKFTPSCDCLTTMSHKTTGMTRTKL